MVFLISSSGNSTYVNSALQLVSKLKVTTVLFTNEIRDPKKTANFYLHVKNSDNNENIFENISYNSTVQKILIENIFLISLNKAGRIYQGYNMFCRPVSKKIEKYCLDVLIKFLNIDLNEARKLFKKCDYRLEVSIIVGLKKITSKEAIKLLLQNNNNLNIILK